ncbi:MAG: ATP-binding protein [Clostridiales bacterium]|nr:ATP-binding protein [Clostridiales bacterium]
MRYSSALYEKAASTIKSRKENAEAVARRHRDEVLKKYPELSDIENEMAQAGLDVIRAMGSGTLTPELVNGLAKHNLDAQKARGELLAAAGYPEDYLKPSYVCKKCEDSGIYNGKLCECHLKLLRQLSYDELSSTSPLMLSSFDGFDLSYYPARTDSKTGISPRKRMSEILGFCKEYAATFDLGSQSIFMNGATGLGKTHLSLAIAGEVVEKGFGVIYGTAQNLLGKLEREHFGRQNEGESNIEQMLLECDLLIIDDLGTEFNTSFTVASVYNIINTRLLAGLPTIINTNLSWKEFEDKYEKRVTSRIYTFVSLQFCGTDIRMLKK